MNNLLIFFAIPIATVIISIALQRILKNPFLVAGVIFAILLVVTFAIDNMEFLVATIVYTIISFITAWIVYIICRLLRYLHDNEDCRRNCNNDNNNCNNNNPLLTIRSNCQNNNDGELLTISSNDFNGTTNDLLTINSNTTNNNCGCNNNNGNSNCGSNNTTNGISARINVIPNSNNEGATGCLCGSYTRR